MIKRRERRDGERGQSLVELAIFLPILIVLFLGIGDLARIFATMITVESAAREAADWGSYRPGNWDTSGTGLCGQPQYICTIQEMERRSCTAALDLPDYVGAADGSTCTNPTFACEFDGGSCSPPTGCDPTAPDAQCRVEVTLTYDFDLIAPSGLLLLPTSITFDRSSTFVVGKDPGGTP